MTPLIVLALATASATAAAGHGAARVAPASDTLARVGTHAITSLDLIRRIEWMPWAGKQTGAAMDSAKARALESLAGEQLLAQEAARLGLGETGRVARMRAALERALVRDALYHDVVATAPQVTPAEVDRALRSRPAPPTLEARRSLRRAVRDSLHALNERGRAIEFMQTTLASQRAEVDSATFMLFADSLRALISASRETRATARGYATSAEDVDALLSRLAPDLDRPLVRLSGAPLTLGDALEDLRFYTLTIHSLQPRHFALELSTLFRGVVEGELMAREGLRRGLDARPEVRRDLAMWTDCWRAQLLIERTRASAPQSMAETRVTRLVAELAGRSRVALDYPALQRTDVLPTDMVTKRLLGFGGGMLAAPSLPPMWDWVPIWRAAQAPKP